MLTSNFLSIDKRGPFLGGDQLSGFSSAMMFTMLRSPKLRMLSRMATQTLMMIRSTTARVTEPRRERKAHGKTRSSSALTVLGKVTLMSSSCFWLDTPASQHCFMSRFNNLTTSSIWLGTRQWKYSSTLTSSSTFCRSM